MKFTKKEMKLLNSAITMEMRSKEPQIVLEVAKTLREKIEQNTMKTIEDLDITDLQGLVYDLMKKSAEVQGVEVKDYCADNYELEW